MAIVALEWASGGRTHTCLSKRAFLSPREDKISHFQSAQLHRGILKKTVLPYEERREHSWKKNDCCTAWTNVILALSCWSSSLHRWEQETFVVSGRPYVRLPPACGCSTCPEVPGLFCQLKCFYSCQKSSTRLVCGGWNLICNNGIV